MALESSFWQRNKRNFILLMIVGAVVLFSVLVLKAYRSWKRFNRYPHSTLPLIMTPNSDSSISSTEVELVSSSTPTEQVEKADVQEQKQQELLQQSKQEIQEKELEQLRLSASLGFLPIPREPEAQITRQNVLAAPAPVKPVSILQYEREKGSDWQGTLFIFALAILFTIFFMEINQGRLAITIIVVLVPGYGCFVTSELAIKFWSLQRKFSTKRGGVVVEGQITDYRINPGRPRRFTTYYIKYSYAYDGKTYSHWLSVPRKRYKAMHNKRSVAVSLLSNKPTVSSLKEYNQIRRDAVFFTGFAIYCLGIILSYVIIIISAGLSLW